MYWKLPQGHFLLQGSAERWPVNAIESMRLPGGTVLNAPAKYYVVTPAGAVDHVYPAPSAYSLEDTLYVMGIYAVIDGQLVEFLWQHVFSHDAPKVEGTGLVLHDLTDCALEDLPFDPAAVIAQYEQTHRS